MIAALFVEKGGAYYGLDGVDPWDVERDARKYAGPYPVVAHPPCHLWVNLAAVNYKRGRATPAWYPGGNDGGCFASALASVRQFGGVLEHPASSHAWKAFGLQRPFVRNGWTMWERPWRDRDFRDHARVEWTCEVWQSAYGHPARKRTWLFYVGDRMPIDMDWCREPGTHQVGWFDRNKPTLGKKAANATPTAFRDALIELARGARGDRPTLDLIDDVHGVR